MVHQPVPRQLVRAVIRLHLLATTGIESIALPRYPEPAHRSALFLVVGEIHKERRPTAIDRPRWLTIPRRALFTGIGIFGAVGSDKTTCCMYPFAEQLLAYRRDDRERRIGGLVLEVKGDFCYRVREILRKHDREDDYIELSLDCPYRYNPLYNDLEAYALAYGIASLLTNLFGRGKEPFWQQAYTNVVKFIVLLHKSVYGYVTLFDVYECAINPDLLAQRVAEGQALFEPGEFLLVDPPDYYEAPELKAFDFEMDPALDRMKVPRSDDVEQQLTSLGVAYTTQGSPDSDSQSDANRREQFEAVERWFQHDWMRIEPKLRTSIVEGISVFLSLFDDSRPSSARSARRRSATTRSPTPTAATASPCRRSRSWSRPAPLSRSTSPSTPTPDSPALTSVADLRQALQETEGEDSVLIEQAKYNEAHKLLDDVLDLARRRERLGNGSELLLVLADLQSRQGRHDEALALTRQAAEIASDGGFLRNEAEAWARLSELHDDADRIADAEQAAAKALQATLRLGDAYALPERFSALAGLRRALGQREAANTLYEQASDILDGMLVSSDSLRARASLLAASSAIYVDHFRLALDVDVGEGAATGARAIRRA